MPYRTVQTFHGQTLPVACPGAENAWTRLFIDPGDAVQDINLAAAEVSNASVLAISNVAVSTQSILDNQNNETIPAGQALVFDVVISKPAGYELPAEEYAIFPYTTDAGDQRRVKQTFSLVDAVEAGGGILASIFITGALAFGWQASAFGFGTSAFGLGA